uniref:MX dynamin like GTPase 1 n=1 Tax=Salvator merianae TaxID=96440 RepID=A0A8D0EBW0_SALMN
MIGPSLYFHERLKIPRPVNWRGKSKHDPRGRRWKTPSKLFQENCIKLFVQSLGFEMQPLLRTLIADLFPTYHQSVKQKLNEILYLQKTEHTLYNQYEEKIRPCIDLIDSLRALGVEKDLALPAIAVIGDQSSGKSSVLEALSGVALPRGSGIVTRCPLALKLKKLSYGEKWKGKITFLNRSRFLQNPSEVETEIRQAQNRIAGEGVGISDELIALEINSPEVPDLTLIDLPGIARVAVGNQPLNIGEQIKLLIKSFIDKQETLNLVVVPSNVDIATTEALKMAQEVDPRGERTLGILTKPDLMDRGTEVTVVNIVRNQIIPLKKGYMIVKCRGQQDIQSNVSLASALKDEQEFFENHKYFSTEDILSPYLSVYYTLNMHTLHDKIRKKSHECIKSFYKDQINFQLQQATDEMRRYGKGMPQTDREKLYVLTDVSISIMYLIKSTWSDEERFESQYRGRELPGFVNYKTFENIIRKHILYLQSPALEMLDLVAKDNFKDYNYLYLEAKNRIDSIKEKQAEEAADAIVTQFAMEEILYCQDNAYKKNLSTTKQQNKQFPLNANSMVPVPDYHSEVNSVTETVYHLEAYFKSAGSRLSCQIPLIIQFYILKKYGDKLQSEMLQLLQEREKLNSLLQERKDAAEQRKFLSDRIDRLTQARQHLAKFSP